MSSVLTWLKIQGCQLGPMMKCVQNFSGNIEDAIQHRPDGATYCQKCRGNLYFYGKGKESGYQDSDGEAYVFLPSDSLLSAMCERIRHSVILRAVYVYGKMVVTFTVDVGKAIIQLSENLDEIATFIKTVGIALKKTIEFIIDFAVELQTTNSSTAMSKISPVFIQL